MQPKLDNNKKKKDILQVTNLLIKQGALFQQSSTSASRIQERHPTIRNLDHIKKYDDDNQMNITCKAFTGKTFEVKVKPSETIYSIKEKIEEIQGIPILQLRLIYSGKQLQNFRDVRSYDFKKEGIVHLVLRLRGDIGIFIQQLDGLREIFLLEKQRELQVDNQILEIIKQLKGDLNAEYILKDIQISQQKLDILKTYSDQKYQKAIKTWEPRQQLEDMKIYLSRCQLSNLIGKDSCLILEQLFSQPYSQIILRRCQAHGKLMKFHIDLFSFKTLQLALNDDNQYEGGKLIFLSKGQIQIPKRKRGTVTIHDNKIVHGVNRLDSGVRYGLFLLQK